MNRVLVFGGRHYGEIRGQRGFLFVALDRIYFEIGPFAVIHGKAKGADTLAGEWARSRRLPEMPFPALWDDLEGVPRKDIRRHPSGAPYNVKAGTQRNQRMLSEGQPTHACGFRGGAGTMDMANRIVTLKIPLFDFRGVEYP